MDATTGAVLISVIALVGTIVSPWLLDRRAQTSKQKDWDRQDLVAEKVAKAATQAAEAATLLLAAQEESRSRTDEVARLAAERDAKADSKLDQIHTLVNSEMTAARQELLDDKRLSLIGLEKMIVLNEKNGIKTTQTDKDEIAATKARIRELEGILADRLQQQRKVEEQQKAAAAQGLDYTAHTQKGQEPS